MSSLLPLIGGTPTPVVEVIKIQTAGTGKFSGHGDYPPSSVETTIIKLIEDKADKDYVGRTGMAFSDIFDATLNVMRTP